MGKPSGYWQSWSNLKRELELILEENKGNFPSQKYLKKNGYSMVSSAIHQHGGFPKIRQKMGYDLVRKPNGYWDDEKNVVEEAKKVIEANSWEKLPDHRQLVELGHSDLVSAIEDHGGFRKFRTLLGEEQKKVADGYWTEERILDDCRKIVSQKGGLPSSKKLIKLGYGGLVTAIYRRKKGFSWVRNELGLNERVKPKNYWGDWNNLAIELNGIISKIGYFPSQKELNRMGLSGVARAINKHGGFITVREKMDCNIVKKPHKYWNKDTVYNEVLEFSKELGHFPLYDELRNNHLTSIYNLSKEYFGGLGNLRNLVERELRINPESELENLLEEYVGEENE